MDVDLKCHRLICLLVALLRIKVGIKSKTYLIITVSPKLNETSLLSIYLLFCQITVVHCILAQWGVWGQCSKTCGDGGSKQRTWHKTRVEENEGTCDGQPSETKQDCAYDWGTNGYPLQRKKYSYIIKVIWVKFYE